MAENSNISWTDHTFNPWIGCTKVSPGCAHCYAETLMDTRYGKVKWGKGQPCQRTSAANWKLPVKWNKSALCSGCGTPMGAKHPMCAGHGMNTRRPRVFCASLADWLADEVPIEWLADFLDLIRQTPNLDWLLLTKRPENWEGRMTACLKHNENTQGSLEFHRWLLDWIAFDGGRKRPDNIWIGTTVEDQKRADERIPALLKIPARVRFLSVEPMLGPVDFGKITHDDGRGYFGDCLTAHHIPSGVEDSAPRIHWAIFGGESGPGARPCNIDWIRAGVRQCRETGGAPFVKQVGAQAYQSGLANGGLGDGPIHTINKKGSDMAEWPADLRVREFPAEEVIDIQAVATPAPSKANFGPVSPTSAPAPVKEDDSNAELMPVAKVEPLPKAAEPLPPSIKENLAKIVKEAGHNFDDVIKWGREAGTIDAVVCDNCGSFDELPQNVCVFLVKNSVGMLGSIARLKGGV